ncbi:phosphatidylinositol N-acetylglucosaminyltransferase [Plectosphaerella cucumerina]|uniref:Phosphatidylinositol N-acetylglucosaminyltransferase n=1 Tax=Plectosphaerella cucumerina TaxID=40658 RepID=A0A8K0TEZ5_9PEZI|nr:phosphatidylinositol N-acetylglucosaminyltransferase [Plectosphaerella cucumerina]
MSGNDPMSGPLASPPDDFDTFPRLARASTAPVQAPSPISPHSQAGMLPAVNRLDRRSHLAPEDAFLAASPPQPREQHRGGVFPPFDGGSSRGLRQRSSNEDSRSRSRAHRNRHSKRSTWKKLLWVKQSYPDNYTDQATFLETLQRNPRLQPYGFWPLVADSTVIVQHVCSVIIFIVIFVCIFQERVGPTAVLSWSSIATFTGWLLWERWESDELAAEDEMAAGAGVTGAGVGVTRTTRAGTIGRRTGSLRRPPIQLPPSSAASSTTNLSSANLSPANLSSANLSAANLSAGLPRHPASASATSLLSTGSRNGTSNDHGAPPVSPMYAPPQFFPGAPSEDPIASLARQRLGTFKSAVLIFSTLLGLSPILKSLTRSTWSDSIWAMSFWLLAVNIFSFDYSTSDASTARAPASLSTNAALMASTVLASRLPSTGQVFSLTLFSIEVFGLFPIFRRAVRRRSWSYHYTMTALLVLGAGGGVGIIAGSAAAPLAWKRAISGMVIGTVVSAVAMGGCSWWLIGLQKYKNEIYGPWDPARPIIMSRRYWED